jgi:hypothetical protein
VAVDAPTRLAAAIADGALKLIGSPISRSGRPATPRAAAPHAAATIAPVARLRALLARPQVREMLTVGIENDPDVITVAQWLGGLLLLGGVPFDHLAADARMLPAESIRFFYIDPNWTGAMIDGALSVGLGSSEESAIQAVLTTQLERMALDAALAQRASALGQPPSRPPTGPICGLLIRSALVTGWPGLVVKGFLAGAKTDLLRLEVIAPNVLVCLFNFRTR